MKDKTRLSWNGNQRAQQECDDAFKKLKDNARVLRKKEKKKKKKPVKRPKFFSKETYQDYLLTKHWRKVRLRKLNAVGWHCERCDSKEELQVHHNHYKTLWHETNDDLTVYCRECHMFAHGHFIMPWV